MYNNVSYLRPAKFELAYINCLGKLKMVWSPSLVLNSQALKQNIEDILSSTL